MTTAVLPRHSAPAADAPAAGVATAWALDRNRCAVALDYDLPGATLWRARLRPLDARLTASSLTASLSAKPLLASLPLTRPLFLHGTPRTARIWVEAVGDLSGPGTVTTAGEISVGSRTWPARLTVRRTGLPGRRLLVVVAGRLVTPVRSFPGTQLRFEAVAEFTPCA